MACGQLLADYGSEGWGFESSRAHTCDVSRHRRQAGPTFVDSALLFRAGWPCRSGGLVVAGGVEDEFAEDFTGGAS